MNFSLRWLSRGAVLLLLANVAAVQAQSVDESLTPISADQISSLPNNWKKIGTVQMNPMRADVKTKAGSGLLVGTPGQPVTLLSNAKDVRIVMDVMVSPGAEATLSLGTVGIRLNDSWGQPVINAATMGTLEGNPALLPDQNAAKAPGLWQRLEIALQSGKTGPARIERLLLNGILLHEDRALPAITGASAGQVNLVVKTGTVALRNVGYQLISDRAVAKLTNLRYKFYEAKTETTSPEAVANLKLVKEDTLSTLSYEVAYGQPRWHAIIYTGDLVVDRAGTYTVALQNGGYASLKIDGKDVVPNTTMDLGRMNSAKINLSAGSHPISLFFGRSWPRPGLGLFISAPDTKFQALHARASLPEPDPVGEIAVEPGAKAALVRSFVNFDGKKRTHCLSVGTPSGLNYTLDLNQDALLQIWRGPFADVTEMWYERGEPQLLKPLGADVIVSGQTPLALLANPTQFWPDSLGELNYKGLTLDKEGNPTTQYQLRDLAVTDAIMPDADRKGMTRTLTISGPANDALFCRLATGTQVEEVAKGLYAVDGNYYVRFDPKYKPTLRTAGAKQELLLPTSPKNGSTTVQYTLLW